MAALAAGASAAPAFADNVKVLTPEAQETPGRKIRFVSIGTGIRGCDLLRAAARVPNGECVGTAELYAMHQKAGVEAYGRTYRPCGITGRRWTQPGRRGEAKPMERVGAADQRAQSLQQCPSTEPTSRRRRARAVDLHSLWSGMWSILWSRKRLMETVQIVLDKKLLQATDRAARRTKRNRSALVRDALREHLRRLETSALEERDRHGYSAQGEEITDSRLWEAEAAWPPE